MTHPIYKRTNELNEETSPYLLQHASNPVHWKSWKPTVLETAKKENKLLLISIGYSTCHWCHVMEKECFEIDAVAQVMNAHFVNIKIDREERPDVDHVYMNALQLMTGGGGWPLNIIALPDGRPVWGATYVKKDHWMETLNQLNKLFKEQPETLFEYAGKLEEGIKAMDLVTLKDEDINFQTFDFDSVLSIWSRQFDLELGGSKRAPKFMMPNNLHFLLRFAHQTQNTEVMKYVDTSLTKMAYGGIFDQVNGGFSRYAVDEKWHIPHFEKMLYDNAQLVSLYSDAYLVSNNPLYREVVYETLSFVERELTDTSGGFYTALDADSINSFGILEEGAYYAFTKEELVELIEEDFELFADYYNVNAYGKWEHNTYVLIRNERDKIFCKKHNIPPEKLIQKKAIWKETLLHYRNTRVRPRLDYKILTAWNGLMITGYVDAYRVFNEKRFLDTAIKCADFLSEKIINNEGWMYRSYAKDKAEIKGFLDDYATVMSAFISLYETTFDKKWLNISKKLADYSIENFYDETSSMFFYTSKETRDLIAKSIDCRDNVIPSSNSMMAKNLHWLGIFFDQKNYLSISKQMLKNILHEIETYPPGYSNWLDLLLNLSKAFYEVVITGKDAQKELQELNKHYLPNILKAGSSTSAASPLLKNRFTKGKTQIYVCRDAACELPSKTIVEALRKVKKQ